MNDKKLSVGQIISVSLMLFAMFFGAGNMIFPPMVGHLAGKSYIAAIFGFITTDAGLSILGIASIVFAGSRLRDLGNLVGPKFSLLLGLVIYLLIGPLFALPRTGTVSYGIAIEPLLGDKPGLLPSIIFTFIFFLVTYLLCLNPSKIVDIVGKVLTPVLLISIGAIFVLSVIHPVGSVGAPTAAYSRFPFFNGFIQGYLSIDGLASLAFAIVVINTLRNMGVNSTKGIIKYSLISGAFAGIALGVVYLALGYVGAQTSNGFTFDDGGQLLAQVVNIQLGVKGNIILGIAVILACLTTSIGLSTSFSDYMTELKPEWSYKKVLTIIIVFSFVVSNIGLKTMIAVTLPALIMIYPPVMALVILSFFKKYIGDNRESYILALLFSFIIGIFDGIKAATGSLGSLGELLNSYLPLYNMGIGWIIPAIVGVLIGLIPAVNFAHKEK